jgi:hypothetical protein
LFPSGGPGYRISCGPFADITDPFCFRLPAVVLPPWINSSYSTSFVLLFGCLGLSFSCGAVRKYSKPFCSSGGLWSPPPRDKVIKHNGFFSSGCLGCRLSCGTVCEYSGPFFVPAACGHRFNGK